jgi:hypothetical protein
MNLRGASPVVFLMKLLALKGEVSCKRYIIYEVRSARKFINCVGLLCKPVYYQIFVSVTNPNHPEVANKFAAGY